MHVTTIIPDDPEIPGLAAISSAGLAEALPELGLPRAPTETQLVGYTPGARATVEVRAGDRHFAVKAYAEDPSEEALLYRTLAEAGLASDSGVRVPRLLGWNRDLRVIAITWLDGRPINDLIGERAGRRAGMLAAAFLRRVASLNLRLGSKFGPGELLFDAGKWVSRMIVSESPLGYAADKVANLLMARLPEEGKLHLVHGTLYARHILDLGDGPGVIDWQRFCYGPLEFDAGTFLATISRSALRNARLANVVAEAKESFWAGAKRLLDARLVNWYLATTLLRQASKPFRSSDTRRVLAPEGRASALAEAYSLIREAGRLAEAIG